MAKILVVDDEKHIRLLLSELLKKYEYDVNTVGDGSEALALLEKERFDLIVTDLHMAQKGGIDVLKHVKSLDSLAEVLILTGYGTISSAVEAMRLGAFEYLTKPIDLKELIVKVQKALERRELRKRIAKQETEIQAHQEMIARDLKLATQVQASIVPKSMQTDRFEVAVRYSPMIGIGGDFSEIYYNESDEIYLTIVDVTGHGIAAALLVNRLCMEVRRLVREQLEPADVLFQLNDFIVDSFKGTGMFLTMFCSALNVEKNLLRYAGSAHPSALLWRKQDTQFEMLESQNQIIGFDKTGRDSFLQNETTMYPGDRLALYTDGIVEVEDAEKNALGINGLIEMLQPQMASTVKKVAGAAMKGIADFAPFAQRDDVYLILLGLK
ncbi:MAG: PP2C family protein-serine/threonine phosphatase [bacterium]